MPVVRSAVRPAHRLNTHFCCILCRVAGGFFLVVGTAWCHDLPAPVLKQLTIPKWLFFRSQQLFQNKKMNDILYREEIHNK